MSIQIDIIIPTFNRANLLSRALKSALNQDYENIKIIVANNNSKDNTDEVVNKFLKDEKKDKIIYFKNSENIGMLNNWRKALFEYCNGDYFLLLSDDDYLIDREYISKAVSLINKCDNLMLVYANGYLYYQDINKILKLNIPFSGIEKGEDVFLSRGTVFPHDFTLCNILFNEKESKKLNPFSNKFNLSSDAELFLKLCLLGNVGVITDYVSVYLEHSQNHFKKLPENYEFDINNVDLYLEPYNFAKKYELMDLNDLESLKQLLINKFKITLVSSLVDYPNKISYTKYFLCLKEKDIYNQVINSGLFKIINILYKLHLEKIFISLVKFRRKKNDENFLKNAIPLKDFEEKEKIK